MFVEQRQAVLLGFLQQNGVGRITEMAEHLGVSTMTIRRDLEKLEAQGQVRRIFGGAVLERAPASEPPLEARGLVREQEKMLIGAAAAQLIQDGDMVILDAGSSTLCLAKHLHGSRGITLVTHSLPILWELADETNVSVVALGGELNHQQKYFHGPLAEYALRQMRIDRVFLGIHGVQAEHGLSEMTFTDIPLKRLFMSISREIIVLADSSKIGQASFFRLCPISEVDKIITDAGADAQEIARLEQAGVQVVVAGANGKHNEK
jgi:DeoR family fructose operon transcriptional repressor